MPAKVVTTLPMSPRPEPALGFLLIPLLAHILGRFLDFPVAGSVNLLGAKGHNASDATSFQDLLTILGVAPDVQWNDSDLPWDSILSTVFADGLKGGWLRRDIVSIFTCPCGKTEFVNKPGNLVSGNFDRKVYRVNDGVPYCLLCNNVAIASDQDSLLLVLPKHIPLVSLIPRYATDTWSDLVANLSGCEIPVSRMRTTGLSVVVSEKLFNVDIDVAWMLYPYLLRERGMDVVVPSRMIHLIQHSVRVKPESLSLAPETQRHDVQELWRNFNGQTLQNALACLRREHPKEIDALSKQVLAIALFP